MATKVLTVSADAKTIKGQKIGILTGVLYFAPHTLSGREVCAKATEACKAACLFTAGRGIYKRVQGFRIAKTQKFFADRQAFMVLIYNDILTIQRKAKRMNMQQVAIRLNGTSDLPWEKFSFTVNGVHYANIMAAFPDVKFYDYTKIVNRNIAHIPNYSLTFSLADGNDADALKALANGMNVAAVIHTKTKASVKPNSFSGFPAIDGDENDVRFLDDSGSIVLLRAKGKAKRDTLGFVKPHDYQIAA